MREPWKDILDFEDSYQISTIGEVKSLERIIEDGKGGYRRIKERILKLHPNSKGYLQVKLSVNGRMKTFSVHRLVAIAFVPNPDNLPEVNHKNENKTDNRAENLEWISTKKHRELHNIGNANPRCRLTEKQILEIREKCNSRFYSQSQIGKEYGIHQAHVSAIAMKKFWKHI